MVAETCVPGTMRVSNTPWRQGRRVGQGAERGTCIPYQQTQALQEPKQEGRASLEIPERLLGLHD